MQPQNNLEWKLQKEILPTYSVKHNGFATERSLPYTQTVGTKAGTFRKQEKKISITTALGARFSYKTGDRCH